MSVVERDMWGHHNTGNEKYRTAVEHRKIGWKRNGLIPKGSADGEQPLQPDKPTLSFPPTQKERCAKFMALMSEMASKTGAVEEHNQAQHERKRAAPLALLGTAAGSSPSKKTVSEYKLEPKINEGKTSSESNSEAEDGEPDWTQVNASKGYGSAAYFVRRDHRKTKFVREREKAELANVKAAKIVERSERAAAAQKAYEDHNLKFPTRPTMSREKRRLTYGVWVEHVEDVVVAEDRVTAIFAKGMKSSNVVRLRDGIIENNDTKTTELQPIVISTTPQEPTAYTSQIFNKTLEPTSFPESATAYTAQAFTNSTSIIPFSPCDVKGKRKATTAVNQFIEIERSLYGWYAPPYQPDDRAED